MQTDKRKPVIKEPASNDNDRKHLQAEAQSDTEPFAPGSGPLPRRHGRLGETTNNSASTTQPI